MQPIHKTIVLTIIYAALSCLIAKEEAEKMPSPTARIQYEIAHYEAAIKLLQVTHINQGDTVNALQELEARVPHWATCMYGAPPEKWTHGEELQNSDFTNHALFPAQKEALLYLPQNTVINFDPQLKYHVIAYQEASLYTLLSKAIAIRADENAQNRSKCIESDEKPMSIAFPSILNGKFYFTNNIVNKNSAVTNRYVLTVIPPIINDQQPNDLVTFKTRAQSKIIRLVQEIRYLQKKLTQFSY